ncbi:MAG: hypothetical protein ACI4XQ_07245 [Eubacteriales bacterium]
MKIDTDEIIEMAKQAANDAGRTVLKLADAAEAKTGEMLDRAKSGCRTLELKNEIVELKRKVGDVVCRAHRGGRSSQTELDDLLFELDAKIDELEAIKQKREANRVVCDFCGKSCPASSRFCPGCGSEL